MVRKAEIGAENVFDFSIGNPSVPAPDAVKQAVLELMDEEPSALHGYTPAAGDPRVRQAVADHIRRRYDVPAQPEQVYLTAGAAAGLAISISAVTEPGDEVDVYKRQLLYRTAQGRSPPSPSGLGLARRYCGSAA